MDANLSDLPPAVAVARRAAESVRLLNHLTRTADNLGNRPTSTCCSGRSPRSWLPAAAPGADQPPRRRVRRPRRARLRRRPQGRRVGGGVRGPPVFVPRRGAGGARPVRRRRRRGAGHVRRRVRRCGRPCCPCLARATAAVSAADVHGCARSPRAGPRPLTARGGVAVRAHVDGSRRRRDDGRRPSGPARSAWWLRGSRPRCSAIARSRTPRRYDGQGIVRRHEHLVVVPLEQVVVPVPGVDLQGPGRAGQARHGGGEQPVDRARSSLRDVQQEQRHLSSLPSPICSRGAPDRPRMVG